VDSTATIIDRQQDGNSIRYLFQLPESAAEYTLSLVTKGYVTIDGTSLTLTSTNAQDRTFGVMLIAHTQEKVIITSKGVGDKVNIEVDVVSKQVSAIVQQTLESRLQSLVDAAIQKRSSSS
jgi:riboflavin synthase